MNLSCVTEKKMGKSQKRFVRSEWRTGLRGAVCAVQNTVGTGLNQSVERRGLRRVCGPTAPRPRVLRPCATPPKILRIKP